MTTSESNFTLIPQSEPNFGRYRDSEGLDAFSPESQAKGTRRIEEVPDKERIFELESRVAALERLVEELAGKSSGSQAS